MFDVLHRIGGREFETLNQGANADAASLVTVSALVTRGTFALPSFSASGGPLPGTGGQGRIEGPPPGTAEERDGDYFGPTLNRVARLQAAGHGGQTLLSLATMELVRDQLPSGVSLLDLGERRLKDLIRSEHIFQIHIRIKHP